MLNSRKTKLRVGDLVEVIGIHCHGIDQSHFTALFLGFDGSETLIDILTLKLLVGGKVEYVWMTLGELQSDKIVRVLGRVGRL